MTLPPNINHTPPSHFTTQPHTNKLDHNTITHPTLHTTITYAGLGLAASVGGIVRITDKMLYTAAVACADAMTAEDYAAGRTFPKIDNIREG